MRHQRGVHDGVRVTSFQAMIQFVKVPYEYPQGAHREAKAIWLRRHAIAFGNDILKQCNKGGQSVSQLFNLFKHDEYPGFHRYRHVAGAGPGRIADVVHATPGSGKGR